MPTPAIPAQPNPYAKVTEQASMAEHERRKIRKMEREMRAKKKKAPPAQTVEKAKDAARRVAIKTKVAKTNASKAGNVSNTCKPKPKSSGASNSKAASPAPGTDGMPTVQNTGTPEPVPVPSSQGNSDRETGVSKKAPAPRQTASPVRKRRSGLRSVGYTYYPDRPPKKIVRRQAMSPSHKRKILKVPRLPGQEDVPPSSSEDELISGVSSNEGADSDSDEEEADADGEDDVGCAESGSEEGVVNAEAETWDGGSQASTTIEDVTDNEALLAEYGEPTDAPVPAKPQAVSNDLSYRAALPMDNVGSGSGPSDGTQADVGLSATSTGFTVASPVAPGPHFGVPGPHPGFGPATGYPAPTAETGAAHRPPTEHPFGPSADGQSLLNTYLSPSQIAMLNFSFPDDPFANDLIQEPHPFPLPGVDILGTNNMLGLNIGSTDLARPFDPNLSAISPHDDPNQSAPGFLAMMQGDSRGGSTTGPIPCASTPARALVHADGRPMVPLPRTPRVGSPAQMSPHITATQGSPAPCNSTPVLTPSFAPLLSSPSISVGANPSRPFSRSYSTPLATPRRASAQLGFSVTRPVTPVVPTAGSIGAALSQPHSPAILSTPGSVNALPIASQPGAVGVPEAFSPDEPIFPFANDEPDIEDDIRSHHRPGSPIYISPQAIANGPNGLIVAASGFPPMKRTRLRSPASFAPTAKEIGENKRKEYRAIQKKRKYNMPQPKNAEKDKAGPRVGVNIGSFTHQMQGYLALMRVSMTFDLIGCSPWNEAEADMRAHAIALADEGTGLKGKDFVSGDFEVTVSRALSSCRSKFGDAMQKVILKQFDVTESKDDENKSKIRNLISGDRFMYADDEKNVADFGNNYAVQDGVVALFFSASMNLGGVYIDKMLREDSIEDRRKLLTAAAECLNEDPPASFDYVDMSAQALCGPPLASIAFAGIALQHELKKLNGIAGKFERQNYAETWARYVRALASHPRLGVIRAAIFEEIKLQYSSTYCQGYRTCNPNEPRAWEWM